MNLLNTLIIILSITQLLDWYSTRTILNKGGKEQNLIVKKGMDIFGMDVFLIAKGIFVVAAGTWVGTEVPVLLGMLTVFYIGIIVHNWKSLK